MRVAEKFRLERCFILPADIYGALMTMLPPHVRFVDGDVGEEHLLIISHGNRIGVILPAAGGAS